MKGEKLKELLVERIKKIDRYYLAISPSFFLDDVHEFRTSTKQLRALMRLLNKASGHHQFFLTKRFRHAYLIAGRIRDIQILQQKIDEDWKAPLPVFYQYLTHSLLQLRTTWEIHFRSKMARRMIRSIHEDEVDDISPEQFKIVFAKQIESIQKLALSPTDENLHRARVKIKDMLYNARMARKEWERGYEALHDLPVERLDHLAQLLGDYHDSNMTYQYLSSFRHPAIRETERNAIQELMQKELEYHMLYKEKLVRGLKSLFKPKERANPAIVNRES